MFNITHSKICNHDRIKRLDDNFVRCLSCGLSYINQRKHIYNKTREEFTKENKSIDRNFHRNFTNIIEEEEEHPPLPFEFYADKNLTKMIIVDKNVNYGSYPIKYNVTINGNTKLLTVPQIKQILDGIEAVQITELEFIKLLNKINIGSNSS